MATGGEFIPIAASGGAVPSDDGEAIAFALARNDGTTRHRYQFVCAIQTVSDLVTALGQALQMAAAHRQARSGNAAAPPPAAAPASFQVGDDAAAMLVRLTMEIIPGAPIEVALPLTQAVQLSENLAAAVRRLS
ncbi:MAG: hypothetical protein HY060_18315 [Proteobacteria bacterium]|nr:hypothetical protein [Pseudomonadota bacterium]